MAVRLRRDQTPTRGHGAVPVLDHLPDAALRRHGRRRPHPVPLMRRRHGAAVMAPDGDVPVDVPAAAPGAPEVALLVAALGGGCSGVIAGRRRPGGGSPGGDGRQLAPRSALLLSPPGWRCRRAYPLSGSEAHHPVVLSFFASWCSPCRRELPTIARVARQARPLGQPAVVFVGIDGNDAPASGLAFARTERGPLRRRCRQRQRAGAALRPGRLPRHRLRQRVGDGRPVVRGPVTRAELVNWVDRLSASA